MRGNLARSALIILAFAFLLAMRSPLVRADDIPTDLTVSICGDGIVETGELCDDGLNIGGYGSTTAQRQCAAGCESYGPYCGDGILQVRFGEQCDFGSQNGQPGSLCSATCQSIPAVQSSQSGSPTVGSIPSQSGTPGSIPSALQTKVVLEGEAYPNATVNILLDGQAFAQTQADSNANFLYSATNVTPGTQTFSFVALDNTGVESITSSETFDVVQSAVTTISNIFIPPSISASATQLKPGDLLTLSGQSVPGAAVVTALSNAGSSTLTAQADRSGDWALQIDSASLPNGYHSAKSYFVTSTSTQSGFGRAVNFYIGSGAPSGVATPDLNGDGKVNLIDFSIFLTMWNTSNPRADFNGDGTVNLADFSIMLFDWTG